MKNSEKPKGYEQDIGNYDVAFYDGSCGEPIDNSIVYEAELKIGGKKTDLLFDENGNAVN